MKLLLMASRSTCRLLLLKGICFIKLAAKTALREHEIHIIIFTKSLSRRQVLLFK